MYSKILLALLLVNGMIRLIMASTNANCVKEQSHNMYRHIKNEHNKTKTKKLKERKEFTCTMCSKKFPKRNKLVRHVETHNIKYTCPTCKQIYKRIDHFESHKQVCYDDLNDYEHDESVENYADISSFSVVYSNEYRKGYNCDDSDEDESIGRKTDKESNIKADELCQANIVENLDDEPDVYVIDDKVDANIDFAEDVIFPEKNDNVAGVPEINESVC